MDRARIAAYLPFEQLLGPASSAVFEILGSLGYQLQPVEDPNSWPERMEPELLLAIFGERPADGTSEATSNAGPPLTGYAGIWLSPADESFVDVAMRTGKDAQIPTLVVILRGELLEKNIQADRNLPVVNVSMTAKSHARDGRIRIVHADSLDVLAATLAEELPRIAAIGEIAGRAESIAGSSVSDTASGYDTLGFTPYVEAIERFVTDDGTAGPLALSIEGEWGSGKSSFMLQLRQRLEGHRHKVVWFNAWRHDREEAMWAAFALQFVGDLSAQLKRHSRFARRRAAWRLMLSRFDWSSGWLDVLKTIGSMVLWVAVAVAIWVYGRDSFFVDGKAVDIPDALWIVLGLGGSYAALRSIVRTARDTAEIIGNPLRFDLKKHIRSEDYAGRISFIERFHSDFSKIVSAYAGREKVFVFIDDLDRCDVPKAAELMQAMNLMIGADSRLIFIIGMDRQKVAAGLAVKYEELLPYVGWNGEGDWEREKPRVGRRFGYEFIEKFIQLPFRVPIPDERNLGAFLDSLSGPVAADTATARDTLGFAPHVEGVGNLIEGAIGEQAGTAIPDRQWEAFSLEVRKDSDAMRRIVIMVAPSLDYNPRRLKQFINTFRLRSYIAYNTGLLNASNDGRQGAVSFEQLAKFVAVGLRWPMLLADLEEDRELFSHLSHYAEHVVYDPDPDIDRRHETARQRYSWKPSVSEQHWREEFPLLVLLALNANPMMMIDPDSIRLYNDHTMTTLDIERLLEVSPQVTPPTADRVVPEQQGGRRNRSEETVYDGYQSSQSAVRK